MPVDKSVIGSCVGVRRVVVERGPVAVFAEAVTDGDPIYRDAGAAAEAGFESIPVPPTFPAVMEHWGSFAEMQPESTAVRPVFGELFGPLLERGGLLLHGEEELEYFAPVCVGDVLSGESYIRDVYEKVSGDYTMTFIITETLWTNEKRHEPAVAVRSNTLVRTRSTPSP